MPVFTCASRSSNTGWSYRESPHEALCGVFISPTAFKSFRGDNASHELHGLLRRPRCYARRQRTLTLDDDVLFEVAMNDTHDSTRALTPAIARSLRAVDRLDVAARSTTRKRRPRKRNEGIIRQILTLIASGTPVKDAARLAGINPTTLWRWRQADEELDRAVQAARAAFLQKLIERIDKAGETDWRASAWLLARSEPAAWGGRAETQVEVESIAVEHPLTGEIVGGPGYTDDEDDLE